MTEGLFGDGAAPGGRKPRKLGKAPAPAAPQDVPPAAPPAEPEAAERFPDATTPALSAAAEPAPGQDVALLDPKTLIPAVIFSSPKTADELLDRVRAKVAEHVPDVTTPKGRQAIKSLAFKVTKTKTALDEMRAGLVKEWKEKSRAVDVEGARIWKALEAIHAEARAPLAAWEADEAARMARIEVRIEEMRTAGEVAWDDTAATLLAKIEAIQEIAIDDSWAELEQKAALAKDRTLTSLHAARKAAKAAEAAEAERVAREAEEAAQREREAAEAEAERARVAEAERVERERVEAEEAAARTIREAEEAAERERREKAAAEAQRVRDAEAAALAVSMAETAKRDAEEAARVAAIRTAEEAEAAAQRRADAAVAAERQRAENQRKREQAEAERLRLEAEARAADVAHRGAINRKALAALLEQVPGLTEDQGRAALVAIISGSIPHVMLEY